MAGAAVALALGPLFWRSGRFSNAEFVFYGPSGHDPLYHVTLLQRLSHHIPPDNFIVSGLRAPVYHYFGDLAQAFILRAQQTLHFGATDLFDLYYRCYPDTSVFPPRRFGLSHRPSASGVQEGWHSGRSAASRRWRAGLVLGHFADCGPRSAICRAASVALYCLEFLGWDRFHSAARASSCPLSRPSDQSRCDQCPVAARAFPARLDRRRVAVGVDGRIQLYACGDVRHRGCVWGAPLCSGSTGTTKLAMSRGSLSPYSSAACR